jgi:mannosyltransferase
VTGSVDPGPRPEAARGKSPDAITGAVQPAVPDLPPGAHSRLRPSYATALGLVTASGGLLRLALLACQPIGSDEDFSAVALHADPARMLDILSRDSAPPLFYLLAWLPAHLWSGPAALRLVPAVAGIALIPLLAALGRRVAGDSAGLWAAAMAAVLPATVATSEFARPYSLTATLAVAAALLMWRAAERPSAGRWLAYAAVAAAALWTDYFAAAALVGIAAAGAWLRPERGFVSVAAGVTAASALTLTPWLVFASAQFERAGQGFWVSPLGPAMLAGTIGQLFAGPPIETGLSYGPALIALQTIAVLAGIAAVAAFAGSWRIRAPEPRFAAVFCVVASGGVALLAIVSLWRPLLDARYAGVMWLPVLALAGAGLAALPRPVAGTLVAALLVPALALGVATTHAQTSSLVPQLDASAGPSDLVAAAPDQYLVILDEAAPQVRNRLHVIAAQDPPWFDGTAAYPPDAVIHAIPAEVAARGGRILWVADPGTAPPSLPAGYRSAEVRCVIGACLTIYVAGTEARRGYG